MADDTDRVCAMELDRKSMQRIRVEMPDGQVGWITTVLRPGRNFVTLVMEFPRSVSIDREEVYLAKLGGKRPSGKVEAPDAGYRS